LSAVIFDTSVYITALRRGDQLVLRSRRATRRAETNTLPLWLSAVVLEELLVGASDRKARQALRRLEREFDSINRLLVPNVTDWSVAGSDRRRSWRSVSGERPGSVWRRATIESLALTVNS
jgi:predicted nucleic acid-binding protein